MEISDSDFLNNYALHKGGGIFTECEEPAFNCKLMLNGKNKFSLN